MMREVSRFGHAAKIALGTSVLGYVPLLWIGPHQFDDGWIGLMEVAAFWTLLSGAYLWIQMSQRVWYDDQKVCTRILGKGRSCIEYNKIASISASRSWKRAAAQRPISELKIVAHDGGEILISLRHLSLPDLQEMVGEIGQRTGLPAPELRKYVS